MKTKVRAAAFVLLIFVLLSVVFSVLLEARHHHTGEDCPVCALIAGFRKLSAAALLFAALFSGAVQTARNTRRPASRRAVTPVWQNVRLLN